MTSQQTAKLTRYNAVISQLNQESAMLATIPALKRAFDSFVAKVAAINGLVPRRQEGSTGETTTKVEARKLLIDELVVLSAQIRGWASEHHDAIAASKAAFTVSDFGRMRGAILPNEGEALYMFAVEHKDALADVGVTGENLDALAALIDNYSEKASLPRNKISTRKIHGQNLETLFAETDALLDGRLENLMMGLKKMNPDVYATFLSNNQVVSPPTASAKTKAANKAAKAAKNKAGITSEPSLVQ